MFRTIFAIGSMILLIFTIRLVLASFLLLIDKLMHFHQSFDDLHFQPLVQRSKAFCCYINDASRFSHSKMICAFSSLDWWSVLRLIMCHSSAEPSPPSSTAPPAPLLPKILENPFQVLKTFIIYLYMASNPKYSKKPLHILKTICVFLMWPSQEVFFYIVAPPWKNSYVRLLCFFLFGWTDTWGFQT